MFTGIVTHRGTIDRIDESDGGVISVYVRPDKPFERLAIGDSIAIDGCCLTVVAMDDGVLRFDAIPETLRKTTLGARAAGDVVNLEAALRVGDPLGGHMVQGHVDGTGTIASVEKQGEDVRFAIAVDPALHKGVIPKGSVTLDGVSLTVGEVWDEDGEGRFSVYLIPHTLEVTGFGGSESGRRVNVELDVIGRWVEHHLSRQAAS